VHQKLWALVQPFSRKIKTDKRGNPLMNADGTPLVVSQDPDDCLGSCILLCFLYILVSVYYLPCLTSFLYLFVFAEKMKDLQALVNEANKKVPAKKRRKNVRSVDHLKAGSDPGSTSGPVVDLEGDDRFEEKVQEPGKRRKVETHSK